MNKRQAKLPQRFLAPNGSVSRKLGMKSWKIKSPPKINTHNGKIRNEKKAKQT